MAHVTARLIPHFARKSVGTLTALSVSLMLGACAQTSDLLSTPLASADAPGGSSSSSTASTPQSELAKATEYWGKQYANKPTDKVSALSYAKNLKAMGEKRKALTVLQDTSVFHSRDPELLGEFGRLALEFDQYTIASKALEIADTGENPDWKVVSARGTLLAKQGQHKAAIPFFERALALSPNQPSVLNNLAMATAMSGDAAKAEDILRTAAATNGATQQVNQNLALVQGLQGKYDEAKQTAAKGTPVDVAAANVDYVKRMVRLPAKATPAPAAVATAPAAATSAATAKTVAETKPLPWNSPGPTEKAALKATTIDTASAATSGADGWQTNVASNAATAAANPDLKGSKK